MNQAVWICRNKGFFRGNDYKKIQAGNNVHSDSSENVRVMKGAAGRIMILQICLYHSAQNLSHCCLTWQRRFKDYGHTVLKTFLIYFTYLKGRKKLTWGWERDCSSTSPLLKCLWQLGLGQAKPGPGAKNSRTQSNLPYESWGPKY